ncbi:xylulose kinase [Lactobacillus paracasei]|uniref:xylulokinase n=1 Tax=Lacticaseibacillus paracasei TaxID=1597 RepID=UPI001436ACC9|nr:xylulokinase [Lacticaseibacillus paracasei]NKF02667.1 xylulose kinase [Lacticaseibacillus paracasei]
MDKQYIGIDLGTSSIKMGLFNPDISSQAFYQQAYQYETLANGAKEIDPNVWFEIVVKGLQQLVKRAGSADSIVGIGITGQMHTTVFLDQRGQMVRPAILWNDTRTKLFITELESRLTVIEESENAKIVSTGSPLANLVWLKREEPSHFKLLRHFLMPVDYIVYRLTGHYSTDYCDASTSSLFDFTQDKWATQICREFGIDEKLLPTIHASSDVIGKIRPSLAERLGLKADVKVVAGTGDNAATALANQTNQEQQPLISLGTSGVVVVPNQEHQLKPVGKNIIFKVTSEDDSVLTQGTVQTGAVLNAWWLQDIVNAKDAQLEQAAIPPTLLGQNRVLFFPHLNGEKTLYADPNLRGAFVGLSLESTRENMYLAVLEGLAFGCRQLYEQMGNQTAAEFIRVVGGGAKSNLWLTIFANVFGLPLRKRAVQREAIEGATMLAIIGDGEVVPDRSGDDEVILPEPTLKRAYDEQYQRYLKLAFVLTNAELKIGGGQS